MALRRGAKPIFSPSFLRVDRIERTTIARHSGEWRKIDRFGGKKRRGGLKKNRIFPTGGAHVLGLPLGERRFQ